MVDSIIRWVIFAIVIVYIFLGSWLDSGYATFSTLLAIVMIGGWISMGVASTRIGQQVPQITMLIDQNPEEAESLLAQAIRRKTIPRVLRLHLYHRLAMLRLKQRRFSEVALICQTILSQNPRPLHDRASDQAPSGPATTGMATFTKGGISGPIRTHLLLMLVESRLWCGDMVGTYFDLIQLHQCRLGLVDRMQLLLLQTKYEIAVGQPRSALNKIGPKIRLAELMPAQQCGAMHAMLAIAAGRAQQASLCNWLRRRAQLLCTPEQLQLFQLPDQQ